MPDLDPFRAGHLPVAEFENVAVEGHLRLRDAQLPRQVPVPDEQPGLPVHGDEVRGADRLDHRLELPAAPVAGNVDLGYLLIQDVRARQEKPVDHAGDGALVPRDELGGEHGGVARPHLDVLVLPQRHQGQRGPGLALRPGGHDRDLPVGKGRRVLHGDQEVGPGEGEISQFDRRLHVPYHALAAECHLSTAPPRRLERLLDPVEVRGEHGDDDAARGLPEDLGEGLPHEPLRQAAPVVLYVRGVGEKRRHAFPGHRPEPPDRGRHAVERERVDLEVSRVDEDPFGAPQDVPDGIGDAVAYRERLDVEAPDPEPGVARDREEPRPVEPVLGQSVAEQPERKLRAVHREVEFPQ